MTTSTTTSRYGRADTVVFGRMHPKIDARARWKNYQTTIDQLPLVEGIVTRVQLERLPGERDSHPMRFLVSKAIPDDGHGVDDWWSIFIRRFDSGTYVPVCEKDLGLDSTTSAHPSSCGLVDLVDHCRTYLNYDWHGLLPETIGYRSRSRWPRVIDSGSCQVKLSSYLPDQLQSRQHAET